MGQIPAAQVLALTRLLLHNCPSGGGAVTYNQIRKVVTAASDRIDAYEMYTDDVEDMHRIDAMLTPLFMDTVEYTNQARIWLRTRALFEIVAARDFTGITV